MPPERITGFLEVERTFYIYCHTAPNGKRYVGQTCQEPEQRWRDGVGYKGCVHFERAIKKYGWDNFEHQILDVASSLDEANELERHYISEFRSNEPEYGYNMTEGGSHGYAFTDEVRNKIKEQAQARGIPTELQEKMIDGRRRNGWRRRPMTEEERLAVSERMRGENHPFYGKKLPREMVEKRAASARGRKASDETRLKQSMALRNSEKIKSKRKPVSQYEMDGTFVCRHESIAEAARSLGVNRSSIYQACHGTTNSAFGYRWEYEDEELRTEADARRRQRSNTSTAGLPVIQLDLDGNEIARYSSTVAASKKTGFPRHSITNCCRGRNKTSCGFIWRYLNTAA